MRQAIVAVLVGLCIGFTFTYQRPQLSEEGYVSPSPVSRFIQNDMPDLYNPPAEIFSKRYGGIGEDPALLRAYAVIGPDCRKVLLMGGDGLIYGGPGCGFAPDLLAAAIRERAKSGGLRRGDYLRLTEAEANQARFRCPEITDFSKQGNVPDSALSGFSVAEDWGRWTDGTHATLTCRAPDGVSAARIRLESFSPRHHRQKLVVSVNGSTPMQFELDGSQQTLGIQLPLSPTRQITLRFDMPDAISPKEAGLGEDSRKLGIGVRIIEFTH